MFAMIAATRPEQSLCETLAYNASMLKQLRATPYPFRRAIGVWQGDMEVSFQVIKPVTIPADEWLAELEFLAFERYEQDAILIVRNDETAVLRDPDGVETPIGQWQEVEDTTSLEGYTIINGIGYAAL